MRSEPKFPWILLPAILTVVVFAYGLFVPGMGGNSDDWAYGYTAKTTGFIHTAADQIRHHSVRLTQAALLNLMYIPLWGNWPAIHIAPIVLLMLGTALLMLLVWKWTQSPAATAAAAALFALHPAANDTTLWPICLGHLAVAVLMIGSMLTTAHYAQRGGAGRLALSLALYLLACGCIEQAALLFPVLPMVFLAFGGSFRRAAKLLAPFLAVAAGYLLLEMILNKQPDRMYGFSLGWDLFKRWSDTAVWTAGMMTGASGEYSPVRLFLQGWSRAASSPAVLAGFILAIALAIFFLSAREAEPRNDDSPRRTMILLLIGIYIFVAGFSIFALRPDARILGRHLKIPLLGMALAVAATIVFLQDTTRRKKGASGARAVSAVIAATTAGFMALAAVADLGEGADYAASRSYQDQAASSLARCLTSPPPKDTVFYVEGLQSHFGRARTFADDWSVQFLLKDRYPELFGGWDAIAFVTKGVDAAPEEDLARALALSSRDESFVVWEAIQFEEDGKPARTLPLPLASLTACPKETLRIEIKTAEPQILFGREVALLKTKTALREGTHVSSVALYLVRTDANPERFPLDIDIHWPEIGGSPRIQHFRFESGEKGQIVGLHETFQFKQIPAEASYMITVRDAAGRVLMPRSNKPFERGGPGAVLHFE